MGKIYQQVSIEELFTPDVFDFKQPHVALFALGH